MIIARRRRYWHPGSAQPKFQRGRPVPNSLVVEGKKSELDFYDHLAKVIAAKKGEKGIESFIQAFINCFLILDLAILDPAYHFFQKLHRIQLFLKTLQESLKDLLHPQLLVYFFF